MTAAPVRQSPEPWPDEIADLIRKCPACGVDLRPSETHWSESYLCPPATEPGLDEAMLRWVADQPIGGGDWACARCHPDSSVLIEGFRCMVHEARARLAPAHREEPVR